MPVVVEVVLLRAVPQLAYRMARGMPLPGEVPDSAALRLAGLPEDAARRAELVVHSTSWRYERGEPRVVLTYVVAPDPDPTRPSRLVEGVGIARGDSAACPAPERVAAGEVAAHALRHLAFLEASDPVVRDAVARVSGLTAVMPSFEPDVARRLHTGP
ncbi:hypothetical protein GCM10023205_68290 [Yinghuangia aomiensis]|uniref:Uncharacterized protein n=1 Tax=Yinghuangia aomiensis TaxID=676205 RepID=A0ABP9I4Q2_9ACTN